MLIDEEIEQIKRDIQELRKDNESNKKILEMFIKVLEGRRGKRCFVCDKEYHMTTVINCSRLDCPNKHSLL